MGVESEMRKKFFALGFLAGVMFAGLIFILINSGSGLGNDVLPDSALIEFAELDIIQGELSIVFRIENSDEIFTASIIPNDSVAFTIKKGPPTIIKNNRTKILHRDSRIHLKNIVIELPTKAALDDWRNAIQIKLNSSDNLPVRLHPDEKIEN